MEQVPDEYRRDRRRIPEARDLQALARIAARRRLPILLAFMSEDCPYCRRVESEFLEPMRISGEYDDKVLMVKVPLDGEGLLRDFDGDRVTPRSLADRYGVDMVPTLVLVDPQGREIAERLVGLTTPDFYGGYLDAAIDTALRRMRE